SSGSAPNPHASTRKKPEKKGDKAKSMAAPIVFFDIAGPDAAALNQFYSELFGWDISGEGRFTTTSISPLPATPRQDPAEKILYIGVDDVAAKLAEVEAKGGAIALPRMAVPGVVVFGLFTDPAGNRMGLVELQDGKAKIP